MKLLIFLSLLTIIALTTNSLSDEVKPKILVHYMPWYSARPVSDGWGWHWTMNHFNPEKIHESGKREIASHYYPLIGPYDSSDPDVLEYHILLMKLAGIDGIIIDWYGIEDFYDYAALNRNTARVIEFAERSGLEFAVCYEDQSVKHMVNDRHISEDDSIRHGQKVMQYLQDNWFGSALYLKLCGRPVLLNFGPQFFTKSSQWDELFSVLDVHPLLFTEHRPLFPAAAGAFPWLPTWKARNGILSKKDCDDYLNQFYREASGWDFVIGGAFPGFNDIYEEAGVRNSYGYLDAKDGETFSHTLHKALENHADIIQIITWNDFGEGTNIEPTEEYGYRYLEIIQNLRREYIDPVFPYTNTDLALPRKLYDLRKKHGDSRKIMAQLDRVYTLLMSGRLADAKEIMSKAPD